MDTPCCGHPFVGIGVPQDIEPMPRISDAILFIGEKPVDDLFICVGRVVLQESVLFGGSRRNPDEVEIDTAEEHDFVRRANRPQAPLLVLCRNERVNGICGLGQPCRNGGPHHWFQDGEIRLPVFAGSLSKCEGRAEQDRSPNPTQADSHFLHTSGVLGSIYRILSGRSGQTGGYSITAATTISIVRRSPSSVPIGPSLNWLRAEGFQLSREPS